MWKITLFTLFISYTLAEKASIGIIEKDIEGADGSEYKNEFISVNLKKPNENIQFVAEVRLHLKNGKIHVNDHELQHNAVHSIRLMVKITDIVNGKRMAPKRKPVELRVLIEESHSNGVKRLLVEEEFITVAEETVEQIEVKQLIWESNIRVNIVTVKLSESKIHKKPRKDDNSMFIADEKSVPHLPNEGLHGKRHCVHHKRSGNSTFVARHYGNAKCWYHHLNWRAKIALFSLGFFGLLTAVICCGLCAQRRKRHAALQITAPIDDSVSVDVDDIAKSPKKEKDGQYDFHFEFDNTVVVDDKKALVEDA